jgi:hypothetical protein
MIRIFQFATLCSLILLSACGRHWIVSDTPIQSAIGQAPALKPRAAGDLRLALVDCAEKFEHDRSYQLNGVSDDNLVASFANEGATFDNCMRAKGWVTFPDVLLAP